MLNKFPAILPVRDYWGEANTVSDTSTADQGLMQQPHGHGGRREMDNSAPTGEAGSYYNDSQPSYQAPPPQQQYGQPTYGQQANQPYGGAPSFPQPGYGNEGNYAAPAFPSPGSEVIHLGEVFLYSTSLLQCQTRNSIKHLTAVRSKIGTSRIDTKLLDQGDASHVMPIFDTCM